MNNQFNYFVVGLFVLIASAALFAVVLWLGLSGREVNYESYVAYFTESVSGLSQNAAVNYQGVNVGRVRSISIDPLDPARVRVELAISPDAPIKTDTVAVLSSVGITGITFVELTGGTRAAPRLTAADEDTLPEIKTGPSLLVRIDKAINSVSADLTMMAQETSEVAEQVQRVFDGANVTAMTETLDNMRRLTAALANRTDELNNSIAKISRISDDVAEVSAQGPDLVYQLGRSLEALWRMANDVGTTAEAAQHLVEDVQVGYNDATLTLVPNLNRTLEELRAASESLKRLGERIERDPSAILYGRARPTGPGE
jgi:phospholipid/cholesterol/gamma-HCH transport system substrate-binding protein